MKEQVGQVSSTSLPTPLLSLFSSAWLVEREDIDGGGELVYVVESDSEHDSRMDSRRGSARPPWMLAGAMVVCRSEREMEGADLRYRRRGGVLVGRVCWGLRGCMVVGVNVIVIVE